MLAFAFIMMSLIAVTAGIHQELAFCSGRSIHDSIPPDNFLSGIDTRYGGLLLDGSDSAIADAGKFPPGVTSCMCTIRNGGTEIPKLFMRHLADGIYRTCGKWIEVIKFGEKAIHRFGCASSESELQTILEEGNITVTLFIETPRPDDTNYKLFLEPDEVIVELYVTCLPPNFPTTTTTTTTTTTSTTTTTTTSSSSTASISSTMTSALTSAAPDILSTTTSTDTNKGILAAVLTSVAAAVAVLLTCVLCYICMRRRKKREKEKSTAERDAEKNEDDKSNQKPVHEHIYSTISHIYASIRSNAVVSSIRKKRSLPKHPLDRLRGKTKKPYLSTNETADSRESGLYDSIRSHLGTKRVKEMNIESVDDLPMSNVDKLVLTRLDSCESDNYIHPGSNISKTPVASQTSTESSKYIHPIMTKDSPSLHRAVIEENVEQNNLTKQNSPDPEETLKPICEPGHLQRSESNENAYTRMDKREYDSKLENSQIDSYMTGRPKYSDSNQFYMSNTLPDKYLHKNNKDVKATKINSVNVKKHDSESAYFNVAGNLTVTKTPVCAKQSGEYMSVITSHKDELPNKAVDVLEGNCITSSLPQSIIPNIEIETSEKITNVSTDDITRIPKADGDQGYFSVSAEMLPKLELCVQPSGEYIPMNCSTKHQDAINIDSNKTHSNLSSYNKVLNSGEESYENQSMSNQKTDSATSVVDPRNLLVDGKEVLKSAICIQPSGDYIPMDFPNKDDSSNLGTIPDINERDSGYEEPIKMKSTCDKNSKKLNSDCLENASKDHPNELFNMANIDLGTTACINTSPKHDKTGNEKGKLKRYIRTIENDPTSTSKPENKLSKQRVFEKEVIPPLPVQKRYVKDTNAPF